MSASYNNCDGTQNDIDRVRLLIPDVGTIVEGVTRFAFTNEEIVAFYEIQRSQYQSSMFFSFTAGRNLPVSPISYFRVAAIGVGILGGNAAKALIVTKLLDVSLNAAAYENFRKQAAEYRKIDDESGAFAIIEQCSTVWGFKQRFWNQWQRQTGGAIGGV